MRPVQRGPNFFMELRKDMPSSKKSLQSAREEYLMKAKKMKIRSGVKRQKIGRNRPVLKRIKQTYDTVSKKQTGKSISKSRIKTKAKKNSKKKSNSSKHELIERAKSLKKRHYKRRAQAEQRLTSGKNSRGRRGDHWKLNEKVMVARIGGKFYRVRIPEDRKEETLGLKFLSLDFCRNVLGLPVQDLPETGFYRATQYLKAVKRNAGKPKMKRNGTTSSDE